MTIRPDTAEADLVELPDSLDAINEYFYERGWTDGLPIVPPTEDRVHRMLAGMRWRRPEEITATLPPAMGRATLHALAVNAVMAGCRPDYLPVLAAAVRAVADPQYGLSHRQTTTHAGAPLMIINGPGARALKINHGSGLFGPGWRANATIGRALRLVLINVGGAIPGEVDRSQHGHPGKYTYCVAENEEANPWEPLHVERGFPADQTVVTVVNAEAPHSITENIQTHPAEILRTVASSMATLGVNNLYSQGHPVLMLGPEHARHIAAAGWTKRDIKLFLFERARQPWGLVRDRGKSKGPFFPAWVDTRDEGSMVPLVCHPDDLIVVVGGGAGGKSMWMPTAGAQSLSVSRPVEAAA